MTAIPPSNLNGGWPELPAEPPTLDELPDDATPMELARAYAQGFISFAPLWRKSVHALQFLYGAMMGTKATLERIEHRLAVQDLPPMRPELPSATSEAHAIGADVVRQKRAYEDNPSTPPGPAPDEVVEAMYRERVRIALLERDAANWARVEEERKTAETDRLALAADAEREALVLRTKAEAQRLAMQAENDRQRINFKWATFAGCVTTGLAILAFLVEHFRR